MSEQSISLEETNKIRVSLGLRPIPVEEPQVSPEPVTSTSSTNESLSLSETNKLRISLGLAPIPEPSLQRVSEQTTESFQASQLQKERDEKLRQKLSLAKSKAEKRRKVKISQSLLDEEEDDISKSTDDWLSNISAKTSSAPKNKKRKITTRTTDTNDLTGVKVSHNASDLSAVGDDVILTLKDKDILDEEDELESELLVQKKRLEKDLAEKLRTNKYDLNGQELSKLEMREQAMMGGDENEGFVLNGTDIKMGGNDIAKEKATVGQDENTPKPRIKFSLEDIDDDLDDDETPNDYAKSKPTKMKKLKKKSKSQSRQKDIDDTETVLRPVTLSNADDEVDDDFELQSRLAVNRLKKQKKNKMSPEELAREIEEEKTNRMEVDIPKDQGVVIDENDEFLSSIRAVVDEKEKDDAMPESIVEDTDVPVAEAVDTEMHDQKDEVVEPQDDVEQDTNFGSGLASTLSFLRSKNVVHTKTEAEIAAEKRAKEIKKEADLKKLQVEIERRKHEESIRADPRFLKLSGKDREEYLQSEMDKFKASQNAREMAEKLKDYNPDVDIKHVDEYGRVMNQKEAFKHLSHQFHGNGESKSKKAKKQKKVEEERDSMYKQSLLGPGAAESEDSNKAGVRIQ